MPDQKIVNTPLSAHELASLDPQKLADLQAKHGLEINLRSTSAAISDVLKTVGRAGAVAEYDRGFDRTTPGYDKYYDRDKAMINPADLVSDPARVKAAMGMKLSDALKQLTPADLEALKSNTGG